MRALLVLLCLLTVSTSAWAECAWVLWLGTGSTYTTFGAYGTSAGEKDCKEALAQLMANMQKDTKQMTEFLKSSSRYLCLPDTVDPCRPKASR